MHRELTESMVKDYERLSARGAALTGYVKMQAASPLGSTGEPARVSIETLRKEIELPSEETEKKTLYVLVKTALELSDIYRHMKWTIYRATGERSFVTSDCPVIKIFTKSQSGSAALFREDVEVRFPLSRKAMLVLTHDMPQMENVARIALRKPSEAKRKFWMLPEIRLETWDDDEVAKANRAQAAHCTALLIGGQALEWSVPIMKESTKNVRMWIEREGSDFRMRTQIRFVPE